MEAHVARRTDEMDGLTVTVATAIAISLSEKALADWRSRRATFGPSDARDQRATIGRLAAMFPRAVKVRPS